MHVFFLFYAQTGITCCAITPSSVPPSLVISTSRDFSSGSPHRRLLVTSSHLTGGGHYRHRAPLCFSFNFLSHMVNAERCCLHCLADLWEKLQTCCIIPQSSALDFTPAFWCKPVSCRGLRFSAAGNCRSLRMVWMSPKPFLYFSLRNKNSEKVVLYCFLQKNFKNLDAFFFKKKSQTHFY